jgi:hypothetical protein
MGSRMIQKPFCGDCRELAQEMRGFHWTRGYGDHLKEPGNALGTIGIGWHHLTEDQHRFT